MIQPHKSATQQELHSSAIVWFKKNALFSALSILNFQLLKKIFFFNFFYTAWF